MKCCIVAYNKAADAGGGILCGIGTLHLENCMVYENDAYRGAGIGVDSQGNATLINNTIVYNVAESHGGGILAEASTVDVQNAIIYHNSANQGSGHEIWLKKNSISSLMTISHSNVDDGIDAIYVDQYSTLDWPVEMITSLPMLAYSFNDGFPGYLLQATSPCINMGTKDGAPDKDFEGDARPYKGGVDIGADEFMGLHNIDADKWMLPEAGGDVEFGLHAGMENGYRKYLLLGCFSGSYSGTLLPPVPGGESLTLPLKWDALTDLIWKLINTPTFDNFMGELDYFGNATATFRMPPVPGLAGTTLTFAYCLGSPFDFVSHPVHVEVE
jgi:hypothetical protein